jgi:hypothetical protein
MKFGKYLRSPLEIAAVFFSVLMVVLALIGPVIAPHDPYGVDFYNRFIPLRRNTFLVPMQQVGMFSVACFMAHV